MEAMGHVLITVLGAFWLPPAGALAATKFFPGIDPRTTAAVSILWALQLAAGLWGMPSTSPVPKPLAAFVLANGTAAIVLMAFVMRAHTDSQLLATAHRLGYSLTVAMLAFGPALAFKLYRGGETPAVVVAAGLTVAWLGAMQVLWPAAPLVSWPEDGSSTARAFAGMPWSFVLALTGMGAAIALSHKGG